jgi:hypothetical protein
VTVATKEEMEQKTMVLTGVQLLYTDFSSLLVGFSGVFVVGSCKFLLNITNVTKYGPTAPKINCYAWS